MKRMIPTLLASSLGLLFAGGALASPGFGDLDINDDDRISAVEFNDYYLDGGVFDTWDADRDGFLDDDEFSSGLFDIFDDDDDEYIDDMEWEAGLLMDDAGDDGFWDL